MATLYTLAVNFGGNFGGNLDGVPALYHNIFPDDAAALAFLQLWKDGNDPTNTYQLFKMPLTDITPAP